MSTILPEDEPKPLITDGEPGQEALSPMIPILLGDIPPQRTPRPVVHTETRIELPPLPPREPEGDASLPASLAPVKSFVRRGYFDPFAAFGFQVDWGRFRKAQTFLFFLSTLVPFLTLLFFGCLMALMYLAGASLHGATSPNPIHELALYPLVFILAKGYWVAYLTLPIGVFLLGWLWAVGTAWLLTREGDSELIDFKKAVGILAMLGAMVAPFAMFPFLRLVALAVLFWYTAKRMEETFDVEKGDVLRKGGLVLILATSVYGMFERKVESFFPANRELESNLNAFTLHGQKLEWPEFRKKVAPLPYEQLFKDLVNFDPKVRDEACNRGLGILRSGIESADLRFRLAHQMAELGQNEAMPFLAKYYSTGQGTSVNLQAALVWAQKFVQANPKAMEPRLEEAKLLMLNKQALEGKRHFVSLAKDEMNSLYKITEFIQKEGFGKMDTTYNYDIQNLYQYGDGPSYSSNSYSYNYGNRYTPEIPTKKEELKKKLNAGSQEKAIWFYRALVEEYGRATLADPDTYGETLPEMTAAELENKLEMGDPVALDIAGDHSLHAGDVVKAREYWIKATKILNNDNRRSNVPFYLKLAESFDPEIAKKETNPKEATKYYLATLLICSSQGRGNPMGLGPLKYLGVVQVPDLQSQAFLDLCMKYEVPEAWAMMGDRCLNGDFPGVPKNPGKARESFLKAQELGYRGPIFFQQLAKLDQANAGKRTQMAGAK